MVLFFIIALFPHYFVRAENLEDLIGSWKTTFNSPDGRSRPLILNVFKDRYGKILATLDEPRAGLFDYPIKDVKFENGKVFSEDLLISIGDSNVLADYEGAFAGRNKIRGNLYTKGGLKIPLSFTRARQEELQYRIPRITESGHRQLEYQYKVPKKLNDGWEISSMKENGIDASFIKDMMNDVLSERFEKIHSILVIKNGKLTIEEYFYLNDRTTKHPLASVTKSFTSALVGIAIDLEFIEDVDENVSGFFPEYKELFEDQKKSEITIEHLLTMKAGLKWDESSFPYSDLRNSLFKMNRSNNHLRFAIERPLQYQPGSVFRYNTGLSYMLDEIIRRATTQKSDKFAEQYLFGPLGINDYVWDKYPDGSLKTGSGLRMRPRDMAKLGYLYLKNGLWKGKRIISEDWILDSTFPHYDGSYMGYGYQWWLVSLSDYYSNAKDSFAAIGYGGQHIFVLPKLDAVVVFTSGNYRNPAKGRKPYAMVRSFIVPALRSPKN